MDCKFLGRVEIERKPSCCSLPQALGLCEVSPRDGQQGSAEVTKFNWQLLLALKDSSLNKFLHAIKSNNSKNIKEKLFDAICPQKAVAELNQGSQMWFFCQLAKQLKLWQLFWQHVQRRVLMSPTFLKILIL